MQIIVIYVFVYPRLQLQAYKQHMPWYCISQSILGMLTYVKVDYKFIKYRTCLTEVTASIALIFAVIAAAATAAAVGIGDGVICAN